MRSIPVCFAVEVPGSVCSSQMNALTIFYRCNVYVFNFIRKECKNTVCYDIIVVYTSMCYPIRV